jgi:hypothetical protein
MSVNNGNFSVCGSGKTCAQPCGTGCGTGDKPCRNACSGQSNSSTNANSGGIGAGYRFALKRGNPGAGLAIRFAVVVDEVIPGGPADQAGILAKDTIIKVNNEPVEASGADMVEQVMAKIMGPIGTTVSVTIERQTGDGKAAEITFLIVRASVSGTPSPTFFAGVPKCRACPHTDQPGKCCDCPTPVKLALAARAAAAQAPMPAPAYPSFVQEILRVSEQAEAPENGESERAVNFAQARLAYYAAHRAVEAAFANLALAEGDQLTAAGEALESAQCRLEQATRAYAAASLALTNVADQSES